MHRLEAQAKRDAEAERQRRAEAQAERERLGTPRRGREPKPVEDAPSDKAQSNFTDAELHIMRTNNKGWDDCGNAQASVDEAHQIIVAGDVSAESNDKHQAVAMAHATLSTLEQAGLALPKDDSGEPKAIPVTLDNGYDSAEAVKGLEALGFDPYIATGREKPKVDLSSAEVPASPCDEKCVAESSPSQASPSPCGEKLAAESRPAEESPGQTKERMAAKVRTPEGRAFYSRRKVIVEPVFGQIKEGRGFRRFLLRGMKKLRGEWRLLCVTHNLLKIWRYGCVSSPV